MSINKASGIKLPAGTFLEIKSGNLINILFILCAVNTLMSLVSNFIGSDHTMDGYILSDYLYTLFS